MKAAVTGTFDGVHRGHRFLLDRLKAEAESRGLLPVVVTFAEHPLSLICEERAPKLLCSLGERIARIGLDVEVLQFNERLRTMPAEEFLAMLNRKYGVTLFLLGFNNRIGSNRLGAAELAGKTIAGVEILAAEEHPTLPVSSSAIREALTRGDLTSANRMLGRPYSIEGTVVRGKQLGRTLGFPTANIELPVSCVIPKEGVYVGRVESRIAVVNIGRRPTVDAHDAPLSIEAHLLDFDGDLYGKEVRLELLARLRDERKFSSLNELKEAIANDINEARKYEQ